MKNLLYLFTVLLLLISSCEKPPEKGEFGNPLIKFYGDAKDDIAYSIAETSDGYVICGKLTILERDVNLAGDTVIVGENPNFGLIKTNLKGEQQWVYNYDSRDQLFDEGRKVIVLDDGSFVCLGTVTLSFFGLGTFTNIFVTKISPTGQLVWEQTYGNFDNQVGYDILYDDASGGFLIVGSDGTFDSRNIYILSIDSSGSEIEECIYETPWDDYAKKAVFFNGLFYVILNTESNLSSEPITGPKNFNIGVVSAELGNFDGKEPKVYGGSGDDEVSDLVLLGNEIAIIGTKSRGVDSKEGLFMKIGPGTLQDSYEISSFDLFEASNVVEINSIALIPGVGIMVSGTTGGADQSGNMLFTFLDNDGNNISDPPAYISGGTGLQVVYDAIIGSDGKVVAVGSNSYGGNSLITLMKFDPWE